MHEVSSPTDDSVQGGAPGELRQTSDSKKKKRERADPQRRLSTETNQVSRAFTAVSPRSAAQACASTRAVGCGLEGSARRFKLRMLRVFGGTRIRPLKPSRWSQRRSTLHWLVSQRTSRWLRLRVSGRILQPLVGRSVVVGGLRVVLLDYGEDIEGEPAGQQFLIR